MNSTFGAFLRSWPLEPWVMLAMGLAAGFYLRGWLRLHRHNPGRWRIAQSLAFVGGLAVLFLALASPIEPFGALFLQVHMLQHLLLMMVAPPLVWLGAPLYPLLLGLPGPIRTYWAVPLLHSVSLRRLFQKLTHPACAWLLFVGATWLWHLPQTYELALRSDRWHYLQHAFFFGTGLLFWFPVIRPFPGRPGYSGWLLVPYLILADVQNTLLSAILTFSDRPLYRFYADGPRLLNVSPLDDQAAAGVLMWVPGSVVFLVPLFVIVVRLLFGTERTEKSPVARRRNNFARCGAGVPPAGSGMAGETPATQRTDRSTYSRAGPMGTRSIGLALPIINQPACSAASPALDVLRIPLIGRFLRWRHARLSLQAPLVILAALIVYDGLRGPPAGPENLAGVLPWVHWRGLVVLGLLSAGNVVCLACPFMLPRTLARRLGRAPFAWPAWLRNKWLALALLVVFLWAYEALALWDSPWWTAWIVLAYFTAAFVIDGFFRGASFCKYVCPIGQFNFVNSLISPWEVQVCVPEVCASCQTRDCIRGRGDVPGCEMHLYQPRKSSNMDCTFCLDCICACPHDNVGILARFPGKDLWRDPLRSGLGRFSRRVDIAALIVVLVFGAFVNAAGMVAPILDWEDRVASSAGLSSPVLVKTAAYGFGLLILPALFLAASAWLCGWLGRAQAPKLELATRFSYALVPIGFSMWLAHYAFHFIASFDAGFYVVQRFARDLGWTMLGAPRSTRDCCVAVAEWLPRVEILILDFGLLFSLYAAYRVALGIWPGITSRNVVLRSAKARTFAERKATIVSIQVPSRVERGSQALKMLAPWAFLIVLLFAAGVWIVLQPMQMRGSFSGGG